MFDLFKRTLGTGPTYASLGNHDSVGAYVSSLILVSVLPHTLYSDEESPHLLGGELAQQYDWYTSEYTANASHENTDWMQ